MFNCVARLGWLNRMTQFKEKAGKDRENASVGLYAYPKLMAADILAYQGDACAGRRGPEAASGARPRHRAEIQQRFCRVDRRARAWRGFFPLPEPMITGPATRVMSLRDGTKKMSKSDASDNSRINLTDDADTIAQKIRKAKTDPEPLPSEVKGLAGRPEAENLVGIYAALAGTTPRGGAEGLRRRAVLRLQAGAVGARRREARADRGRDAPASRRSRRISMRCSPTARERAAPSRSRSSNDVKDSWAAADR